jgi:hypothetical protein
LKIQYSNKKKTQTYRFGITKASGTTWDGNACRRWLCAGPTSLNYSGSR